MKKLLNLLLLSMLIITMVACSYNEATNSTESKQIGSEVETMSNETTEIYNIVGYEPKENEIILIDNDKIKIVHKGSYKYEETYAYVEYYALNKTDNEMVFDLSDVKIGELEGISTDFSTTIPAKEEEHSAFIFTEGIEDLSEINNISFSISFLNPKTYDTIEKTDIFTFDLIPYIQ